MTVQIGEILIYKEIKYFLDVFLLETYFEEFPDKKPIGEIESCMWRGYFADYKITNNELFVLNLKISINNTYKSVINDVFPGSKKMIWFTGLILLNLNNKPKLNKKNIAKTDLKEEYLIFQVQKGIITEKRVYDWKKLTLFKKEQTEYFKLTSKYDQLKEKYKNKIQKNLEYEKETSKKKDLNRFKYTESNFNKYVEIFIIEHSEEFLAD